VAALWLLLGVTAVFRKVTNPQTRAVSGQKGMNETPRSGGHDDNVNARVFGGWKIYRFFEKIKIVEPPAA